MKDKFIPDVGDIIRVSMTVQGPVQKLRWDPARGAYLAKVKGDWWVMKNDAENCFSVIQPEDATCRLCGAGEGEPLSPVKALGEATTATTEENFGDDGKPNDGGGHGVHHAEWECANVTECRARRHEFQELSRKMARSDDLGGSVQ